MPGRKRKQQESTDDAGAASTSTQPAKKPPNKMTVAELKKELQDRGLDTSGKKAELVARLEGAKTSSKGAVSTDSGEAPKTKKQKTEPGMQVVSMAPHPTMATLSTNLLLSH